MKRFENLHKWLDGACSKIGDADVRNMFRQCFLNTLETTTEFLSDGTTYIFTGDIPAMWLRDSSAQVSHYLHLLNLDNDVKEMVKGLIRRQAGYIVIDPYANAFNKECNGNNAGHEDYPAQNDWVWERKYEVDSLCSFLDLVLKYFSRTHDSEIFDESFFEAFKTIVKVFKSEQNHNENSEYSFTRKGEFALDTLANGGKGRETAYTGMTWTGFRPSDDKCEYGYLIPANLYAARVLRDASVLPVVSGKHPKLAADAIALSNEITQGVNKFGIVEHKEFGRIYTYETDGLGNTLLMDDANVPSLLSLPYLKCCDADDNTYVNTRKFLLSKHNPYFYEGRYASGIGSPHTPKNYIWHIALTVQALTSADKEEKEKILDYIKNTHAETFYMHESFDKDNPANFTREWFAWANSLFAEFIIEYYSLI